MMAVLSMLAALFVSPAVAQSVHPPVIQIVPEKMVVVDQSKIASPSKAAKDKERYYTDKVKCDYDVEKSTAALAYNPFLRQGEKRRLMQECMSAHDH